MPAIRLIVTGKVQGVFYRAESRKKAMELGLAGWVRNRDDGSVEVHAEGPQETLEQLMTWCRRGPAMANVQEMSATPMPSEGRTSFDIRP